MLRQLRESLHPIYRLRRHRLGRAALHACDIPYWATVADVDFKVRARVISHASAVRLRGGAEPGIVALLRAVGELLKPVSFWDVGANIGYYSWLFKSWFPECRVTLFEPDPANADLILQTLRRAELEGVIFHPCAISDISGERIFITDELSGFTGTLELDEGPFALRHWAVAGNTVVVQTRRLDDVRNGEKLPVSLIKIDVEGHEEAAFRGAAETIARDRPLIIYECFHQSSPITDFLRSLGYGIFDAERFSEQLNGASNFLAVPEREVHALESLTARWRREMALVGR